MSEPGREPPTYYAGDTGTEPSPRGNGGWGRLAGCAGCAVLAVVSLVLILGGVLWAGMKIFEQQVAADLRENPVILERLGRIESLELALWPSLSEPAMDDFVFEATGTFGQGTIRATCITVTGPDGEDAEQVTAGTLQLPSGEVLDLFPERLPEALP